MSDFVKSFDGLVRDSKNVLAEFVDWESSSPTYSFNEWREQLCGDTKFGFDVKNTYLYGIYFTWKEKIG